MYSNHNIVILRKRGIESNRHSPTIRSHAPSHRTPFNSSIPPPTNPLNSLSPFNLDLYMKRFSSAWQAGRLSPTTHLSHPTHPPLSSCLFKSLFAFYIIPMIFYFVIHDLSIYLSIYLFYSILYISI